MLSLSIVMKTLQRRALLHNRARLSTWQQYLRNPLCRAMQVATVLVVESYHADVVFFCMGLTCKVFTTKFIMESTRSNASQIR